MKQIRANTEQQAVVLNSKEIQDIIETNGYFEEVADISDRVQREDILAYQVKLDSAVLEEGVERDLEEEGYLPEDEEMYTSVLLEQAEYFIDAAVDDIKERIETRYQLSNIGSAYDIYNQQEGSVDQIGFVLSLSFGETGHNQLYQITSSMADHHMGLQ